MGAALSQERLHQCANRCRARCNMPLNLLPHEQEDRYCYANNAAANEASHFCDNTVITCVQSFSGALLPIAAAACGEGAATLSCGATDVSPERATRTQTGARQRCHLHLVVCPPSLLLALQVALLLVLLRSAVPLRTVLSLRVSGCVTGAIAAQGAASTLAGSCSSVQFAAAAACTALHLHPCLPLPCALHLAATSTSCALPSCKRCLRSPSPTACLRPSCPSPSCWASTASSPRARTTSGTRTTRAPTPARVSRIACGCGPRSESGLAARVGSPV